MGFVHQWSIFLAFVLRRPPKLSTKRNAYPYQLDALLAVKSLTYAAIFHEQGLGKTKIATDLILQWLTDDVIDTVFVITKKSLVRNWVEELSIHSYVTPRVLSGNRRENSIALNSPVLIYVMNYEVISSNLELLKAFLKTCRVGAVLDESQKIKNPESNLSKNFHSIAQLFERRIILTGTPVANRPYDIWSQIKFLDNGQSLGDFSRFKSSLDLPSNPACASNYSDKLGEVMQMIKEFTVRETKQSSGIELPEKTILTHMVNMEDQQSEIYAAYRDVMRYEFEDKDSIDNADDILKRLLRLVQCASNPILIEHTYNRVPGKFNSLIEILNEVDLKRHKAIVWTSFINNVIWLSSKLTEYSPEIVHGNLSVEDRSRSIDKFRFSSRCRLLIATPGAAKEGLTLTVANHAIYFDRSFSLDDYLQSQDRIHRISQTQDCYVHNLVSTNTIDEWVDLLLNAKYKAAQLTQGDISESEFNSKFDFDLSNSLKQILSTE